MNELSIPNRVIDWQQVIRSIRASGMTQAQIALAVGCSQVHVSQLLRGVCGKRVGFPLAVKLLTLQQERGVFPIASGPEATSKDEA